MRECPRRGARTVPQRPARHRAQPLQSRIRNGVWRNAGLCGSTILRRGTPNRSDAGVCRRCRSTKLAAGRLPSPVLARRSACARQRAGSPQTAGSSNGSKTFITNAPYADVFIVYAKLDADGDGERRPPQAVLERGMKGLGTGKPLEKMGMYTSPTGEVFLEDVEVERDHLLGGREREPAHGQVIDVFKGERTGVAQMCLGIIERVLQTRCDATERRTWGTADCRLSARPGKARTHDGRVREREKYRVQAAPRRKARHARFARRSERTKLY